MSDANSTVEVETLDAPVKPEIQDRKLSSTVSYSLWPPRERARKAVVDRLIEILTTSSPLSRFYGTFSADEAGSEARLIEQEAFVFADGGSAAAEEVSVESGIKILQIYSKEISKRVLEIVKAKNNGAAKDDASGGDEDESDELKAVEIKAEELKIEE